MAVTQSIEPLDYPAAHSMDTDWFGIDGNGNVAVFSTGENGILPEVAATEIGMPDLVDLMLQEGLVKCELGDVLARQPNITKENLEQIADRISKRNLGSPRWKATDAKGAVTATSYSVEAMDNGEKLEVSVQQDELTKELSSFLWDCLFVCAEASVAAPLIPPGERGRGAPRQVRCTTTLDFDLLSVPEISLESALQLFRDGIISRGWTYPDLSLRRFGFFQYDTDDYCDNRYLPVTEQPLYPITIEQLPLRVQEQIASASFPDISFARKDEIWPRRYYRCRTWHAEL